MPQFEGSESVVLAVGIIGATVMPHVIYLHSALTQDRIVPETQEDARVLMRYTRIDVIAAMTLAGLINLAMLVMAASTFASSGFHHVTRSTTAHRTLEPLLGSTASALFAVALLGSGLSSSAVGTLSGQVVMQGFVQPPHPGDAPAAVTMAAGLHRGRDRRRPDPHPRPLAGRALVRDPVRADPARPLHRESAT